MLLGVHCSVAGGLEKSFIEAQRLGIDTFQIFSRNQRQWKAKPISNHEQEIFHQARTDSEIKINFSHASYLINLGSANEELWEKSVIALLEEIERCTILGLSYCVMHPGAAGAQTPEEAIARIAAGLITVFNNSPQSKVKILLENTAGQGSSIGGKFESLARIQKLVNNERLGFCMDTCHAFAAGYDIRSMDGFRRTIDLFDSCVGLENLKAFHLNDSKGELGSRLDRHEHIGQGKLGLTPFQQILRNFPNIPKVLETPKENDMDMVNLKVLRDLI